MKHFVIKTIAVFWWRYIVKCSCGHRGLIVRVIPEYEDDLKISCVHCHYTWFRTIKFYFHK